MGIFVTITMLLGLLSSMPFSKRTMPPAGHRIIAVLLLLAGLWNALWFGLRHLQLFWGIAAIVSGIAMIFLAVLLLKQYSDGRLVNSSLFNRVYITVKSIRFVILLSLLLSFLLYAISLIRLNLGLAII